jgi:hypothetical protein
VLARLNSGVHCKPLTSKGPAVGAQRASATEVKGETNYELGSG